MNLQMETHYYCHSCNDYIENSDIKRSNTKPYTSCTRLQYHSPATPSPFLEIIELPAELPRAPPAGGIVQRQVANRVVTQQQQAPPVAETRPRMYVDSVSGDILDGPYQPLRFQQLMQRTTEEQASQRRIQHLKSAELSPQDIANMDSKECPVCIEEITPSDNKVALLDNCQHKFHFRCIERWLKNRDTCPMCQQTAVNVPLY